MRNGQGLWADICPQIALR